MYLESFGSLPWHVLVRFGKWEAIINRPVKEDEDVYCGTVATSRYARGIAFAVLGRLEEADAERSKFYAVMRNTELEKRFLFINVLHDPEHQRGILDVAEAVLNGEVEYHKGNFKEAFEHLRLAVERDTNLQYDEPWGWMTPARHVLGALLLERGEAAAAEAVYREDLKQYQDNLWSLLGLHQALKKQQKVEEAELVFTLFQKVSVLRLELRVCVQQRYVVMCDTSFNIIFWKNSILAHAQIGKDDLYLFAINWEVITFLFWCSGPDCKIHVLTHKAKL